LAKQSDDSVKEELNNLVEFKNSEADGKKPFIEPEISPAVDVLEATTFFQTTTSGATN
jgi:hypothetical protein